MKKRILFFSFLFLSFLFSLSNAFGQQTLNQTDHSAHFRQAQLFFDANNFLAAREEYRVYLNLLDQEPANSLSNRVLAEYYIAMCSIYSMRPEAEIQAVRFVENYPESPYSARLIKEIGVFFYETGDWVRAIRFLSNSSQTNSEHKYFLAVSHYKLGQFDKALALFDVLKFDSEEDFSMSAAYYAGVMHFQAKKYQEAIDDFRLAEKDPTYGQEIPQWISSAYMKLQKYTDLVAYAEPLLADTSSKFKLGELSFILAELQFAKKEFAKSAENYRLFQSKEPNRWSPTLQFKQAFALYKSGQLQAALPILERINPPNDSLSVEIAKTRVLILVELKQFDTVYSLLDELAMRKSNASIKQDFLWWKLTLLNEHKEYTALLKDIKRYQMQFPATSQANLLVQMAVDGLRNLNNLSLVEDFMLHFPFGKSRFQGLYQGMQYARGSQFFVNGDDKKAVVSFKKSLEFPINREMAWQAKFGSAEILARANKNSDAIKIYLPLLAETSVPAGSPELSQRIRLSLAHSFAFITMYDRAQDYFEAYVANKLDGSKSVEDYQNAAEVAIAAGKVDVGLQLYDLAIDLHTNQEEELRLRKALILFNARKFNEAADAYRLAAQVSGALKADYALFKASESLFRLQTKVAYAAVIQASNDFIRNKPVLNPYKTSMILLRAQAYENTNQWSLALDDYTEIIKHFTADSTSKDAIVGATEILRRLNRSADAVALHVIYAAQYGEDPDVADQLFEICTGMFAAKQFKILVPELVKFMQQYPQYHNMEEVHWMLGFATYQTKDIDNSMTYLTRSLPIEKQMEAQWLLAQLSLLKGNKEGALNYLSALKQKLTQVDSLFIPVQDQVLTLRLAIKNYTSLEALFTELNPNDSLRKSKFAFQIGQALLTENEGNAKEWFVRAAALNEEDLGAASLLQVTGILARQQAFAESNALIITNFVNADGTYYHLADAMIGKAYLQMASNFIGLKNVAQAKAILTSIIDTSTDAGIKSEAKKELDKLK